MVHDRIVRTIPEDIAVEDITGIELSYVGDFRYHDRDFRRCIDLRTGTYVSRMYRGERELSKELDADDFDAIRRIIADSGILDIEQYSGIRVLDGGHRYIKLLTRTDRYTIDKTRSVGTSFSCFWNGIMEIFALDDSPEGRPDRCYRRRSCVYGNRTPTQTTPHTVQPPAE